MNILYVMGILVAFVAWGVLVFNNLVRLRNRAREAFSDIQVQLKRRHDLVPNLLNTVKGYAAHEKRVFERVTEARTRAMGATGAANQAAAENMLSQALKSLFAVTENYPDLKASANFLELQRELRDTEDKIQAARRFFNRNALELNTKIESVPSNLIAMAFSFKKETFFKTEAGEEKLPQVKF